MEEFDSHTEHAGEQAHEAAHESKERWVTGVALTAAILAALAAITSMLSGHHEHESMMKQMETSDRWGEYQAEKIKTLERKNLILTIKKSGTDEDKKGLADLQDHVHKAAGKEKDLKEYCDKLKDLAPFHDRMHMILGAAVTLFQVAIAVAAVSALTRRRAFWFVGITLGAIALGFLGSGLLYDAGFVGHRPPVPKEPEEHQHAETTHAASSNHAEPKAEPAHEGGE